MKIQNFYENKTEEKKKLRECENEKEMKLRR